MQGITYEELAATTGELLRETNFDFPAHCIPALRRYKGFENVDPRTKVLHCVKPGTGVNDAPRCFSMKLARTTRGKCGMTCCTVDSELLFLHELDGTLLAIMCIHVDDLRLAGHRDTVIKISKLIEEDVGQLKIDWHNLASCDARQNQDATTYEINSP